MRVLLFWNDLRVRFIYLCIYLFTFWVNLAYTLRSTSKFQKLRFNIISFVIFPFLFVCSFYLKNTFSVFVWKSKVSCRQIIHMFLNSCLFFRTLKKSGALTFPLETDAEVLLAPPVLLFSSMADWTWHWEIAIQCSAGFWILILSQAHWMKLDTKRGAVRPAWSGGQSHD